MVLAAGSSTFVGIALFGNVYIRTYERPLLLSCRSQEQAEIKFRDISKTLVKR